MEAEAEAEAKAEMQIEKRMREPLSKVLAYRTTESEAQKIKKFAAANGVSTPDVIRSALHTTGVI